MTILLLLSASAACAQVVGGLLDLREHDFSSPVNLSGDWLLTLPDGDSLLSPVPGRWNTDDDAVVYTLTILSRGAENLLLAPSQVNSRYDLYLNDKFILSEDSYRYLYIPISLQKGSNSLAFHINGADDPVGGIRSVPYLGTSRHMLARNRNSIVRDAFFAGCSLIIAVFFMVLFVRYKQERSSLYFSLLSLSLALRGVVTNDKLLFYFLPDSVGFLVQRLEYLAVYLLPLLFALFIRNYFADLQRSRLLAAVIYVGFLFPITVIVLPPILFKSLLFYYFGFAVISMAIAVGLLVTCVIRRVEDSLNFLIALSLVFLAALYDISVVIFRNTETHILSISLIAFILYMMFSIFRSETRKLEHISEITRENIRVNMYLSKFVPSQFVKTVGLGDLLSIKKGDGVAKKMSVVFTRIHNFDERFKNREAEETITLLNQYYAIICPVIHAYGGFVDKFMDETTMAVFPGKCDDALDAVIAIHNAIDEYNRKKQGVERIKVCSGVHFGLQFIGIVGDNKRVDATVISKVVNTCSRIQSFTSKIDQEILISGSAYANLQNKHKYQLLFMGKIKLKGNLDYISIHSLGRSSFREADMYFSKLMRRIANATLQEIEASLIQLAYLYQGYKPAEYYLELISKNRMLEDLEK